MTWARLDDQMAQHPKVGALGDAAFRLHVSGICYCANNLTDGFIPKNQALNMHRRAPSALKELSAGEKPLWIDRGDQWEIHDYLEYNPSRAEVEELSEKRSESGKRAAEARWHKKPHSKSHTKTHARADSKKMPRTPLTTEDKSSVVPRPQNEQWNGLAGVFGYDPPPSERSLWGKLSKQLAEMGATHDSIIEASVRYHLDMPGVTWTPTALVKHYPRLMSPSWKRPAAKNSKPGMTAADLLARAKGANDDPPRDRRPARLSPGSVPQLERDH